MKIIVSNVAVLVTFALVGWILSKMKIVSSQNVKLLSALEVWLFLPCKTFQGFRTNFTTVYLSEKYMLLVASAAILAILAVLNSLLVPLVVKDRYRQKIVRYSLTVPNYGYFGYALAEGIWGELALLNVLIFAMPISVYTYTEGYRLLMNKEKVSLRRMINPVFCAVLIGCLFGLMGWNLPPVFDSVVEKSAACMSPVSMLLTGILISEYPIKQMLKKRSVYLITVLRLLVIPLVLGVLLRFVFTEEIVMTAVLLYAMPCGLNTIIFPTLVGEDCRMGASLAMVSTLCSMISVPICIQAAQWLCGTL